MCGIAGFISATSGRCTTQSFSESLDLMTHRGPDDEGIWSGEIAMLGSRRLSIIDLGGGKQPMEDVSGRYVITFNGAIYNFPELRRELEQQGASFRTRSDTEVILECYKLFGENCVSKLNGMFAFAIWDKQNQTLYAARDRLGVKPFYFSHEASTLAFASEIKSLLAMSHLERKVDWNSLAYFFTYNYIPAPQSIFKGVNKLLPGQSLNYYPHKNILRITTYWKPPGRTNHQRSSQGIEKEILEKLTNATKVRLVGDVPVGSFLSGGLDSTITTALMCRLTDEEVHTFSIGFENHEYDESHFAKRVSKKLGTTHHELLLDAPNTDTLEKIICQFDEPFADPTAIPTFFLSKLARQHVKVALSGDGADEIFGGYNKFFSGSAYLNKNGNTVSSYLWRILGHRWPANMRGRTRLLTSSLNGFQRYSFSAQRYTDNAALPTSYQRILHKSCLANIGVVASEYIEKLLSDSPDSTPIEKLMYVDVKSYLPENCLVKVDRSSMLASLEVRNPFLDYELVEYVLSLPGSVRLPSSRVHKELLKVVAKDIAPQFVIDRPKQGFDVPIGEWLRGPWKNWASDVVGLVGEMDIFRSSPIERMWLEHIQGKRDWTYQLWILIVFAIWDNKYSPDY